MVEDSAGFALWAHARQTTLHGVLREAARSEPDRMALIDGDLSLRYADLHDRVERLAGALAASGIGLGDRVAWLGQNSHRWLETLVACGRIGAMLCSLNWRLSPAELVAIIDDVAPGLVIFQRAELNGLAGSVRSQAGQTRWIAHDDPSPDGYEALLGEQSHAVPQARNDADAPVLLLAVASSDGDNRVSMLSHANLIVPALTMAHLQDIDRSTVNLASAPLFHIAALFTFIPTLLMRGTNVMVAHADAEQICRAISRHRCTHGFLLSPTADAILALPGNEQYDLTCFRSNVPQPQWRALVCADDSRWGRHPGGYGQTETHMAVLAALGDSASMTSGRTAPYAEVIVADPGGREVPPGALGEILVRGPNVHLGYWQREALNRERFRGGWWHTGDLGHRSADGMVVFVGPAGRMLKSGAENIYASEIERCLGTHEGVAEVAIIGIPDRTWGQSICAIVVAKEGIVLEADSLRAFCKERLASYKKPRKIVFRTEPLPRAGAAIDYAALDAAYGGGGYPGEGTKPA